MCLKSVLLLALALVAGSSASYLDYDGWLSIKLYHALDAVAPDAFTLRGNATVTNLNSGAFSASQEPLTRTERDQLKQLAERDDFYRLRAVVTGADGTQTTFLTSTKACALAGSQLTDVLWVSLNHAGTVLAVSQTVSGQESCDRQRVDADALAEFNTDVFVKHTELAPIPDTASFVQKVEREREARDRGEVKDNRSFLGKYWMYIVPVVILALLTGGGNPDAAAK